MRRLVRAKVSGFRALSEVEMEFGDVTVLVGPNSSGKSSFADALVFVAEALETSALGPLGVRGGLRALRTTPLSPLTFALTVEPGEDPAYRHDYALEIDPTEPSIRRETLWDADPGDAPHVFERGPRHVTIAELRRQLWPDDAGEEAIAKRAARPYLPDVDSLAAVLVAETLQGIRLYSFLDVGQASPIRRPYDPNASTSPDYSLRADGANMIGVLSVLKSDLRFADLLTDLEEWLREAFDGFDGVGIARSFVGPELALQWREYGHEPLHSGQLSDGILRFLCLACLCASPQPPSVAIVDEPELGLHPRLLPLVGAMLRGLGERTQVLVITHSPTLLSAFQLDSVRVMSRTADGCHVHTPGSSVALRELLKPTVGETLGSLFESGDLEVPPVEEIQTTGERDR